MTRPPTVQTGCDELCQMPPLGTSSNPSGSGQVASTSELSDK